MITYTVTVDDVGDKRWYNAAGKLHRVDGPAVERADGSKSWYQNGQRHRVNGAAVEYADGSKEWWVNGQLHRVDGPAVERADGSKLWYLYGEELTETEFNRRTTTKELSIADIEKLLGYPVKVVK